MKYAIISDIHGNLEALNYTLEICQQENVDSYVCLGDVVGYNANPKECLDIVLSGIPEVELASTGVYTSHKSRNLTVLAKLSIFESCT